MKFVSAIRSAVLACGAVLGVLAIQTEAAAVTVTVTDCPAEVKNGDKGTYSGMVSGEPAGTTCKVTYLITFRGKENGQDKDQIDKKNSRTDTGVDLFLNNRFGPVPGWATEVEIQVSVVCSDSAGNIVAQDMTKCTVPVEKP